MPIKLKASNDEHYHQTMMEYPMTGSTITNRTIRICMDILGVEEGLKSLQAWNVLPITNITMRSIHRTHQKSLIRIDSDIGCPVCVNLDDMQVKYRCSNLQLGH
jgi:hypothetical protein